MSFETRFEVIVLLVTVELYPVMPNVRKIVAKILFAYKILTKINFFYDIPRFLDNIVHIRANIGFLRLINIFLGHVYAMQHQSR